MSSKRARTVLILVACAFLISATTMFGQAVNGTLLGTLSDSSGAVVAGAKVTITEQGTGIPHTTETNASGNYVFPNLPPGNYDVTSEAHGFKKVARTGVRLDVNQSVRVDMTMELGAVTETVEVSGAVPLLKTDRADVSQNIESAQLQQLPVGGAAQFLLLRRGARTASRAAMWRGIACAVQEGNAAGDALPGIRRGVSHTFAA